MKFNLRYPIIIICVVLGLISSSCLQDDDASAPQGISEDEAADIIDNTVSSKSQGLTDQLKQITVFTENINLKFFKSSTSDSIVNPLCGLGEDSTIREDYSGPKRSYNYEYTWQWTIKCVDSNAISGIDFICSGTGSYDGPELSSESELDFHFNINNLFSGDHYLLNGKYINEGTYHFKEEEQLSTFTSILELTFEDISIHKTTKVIDEGYAIFSITGKTSEEQSFKYKGTLIFNDDNTATLKFGSGNTYIIKL